MEIAIVQCGVAKVSGLYGPVRADELYCSTIFRKQITYAKQEYGEDLTYILSKKYGLLKCSDMVLPYDVTNSDPVNFTYFGGHSYLPTVNEFFCKEDGFYPGIGSRIGILHSLLEAEE